MLAAKDKELNNRGLSDAKSPEVLKHAKSLSVAINVILTGHDQATQKGHLAGRRGV